MPAHVYYAKERARLADAYATKLTVEQVFDVRNRLCDYYRVPHVPVTFKSGTWSWFKPDHGRKPHIVIAQTAHAMTAMVVIHEVAHYVHWHRWMAKVKEVQTHSGWTLADLPKRGRWHGVYHARLVDEGDAHLRSLGMIKTQPLLFNVPEAPSVIRVGPTPTQTAQEAWWTALPAVQHCNRCDRDHDKEAFGMRVVSKDLSGVPVSFARQGYCRDCRKEYAANKKNQMQKAA